MSLQDEIAAARNEMALDSFELSISEIMHLYQDGELCFQAQGLRRWRWDEEQKTRIIESLLLGIPLPPIYVLQKPDGTWEVIDGLKCLAYVRSLLRRLV